MTWRGLWAPQGVRRGPGAGSALLTASQAPEPPSQREPAESVCGCSPPLPSPWHFCSELPPPAGYI